MQYKTVITKHKSMAQDPFASVQTPTFKHELR